MIIYPRPSDPDPSPPAICPDCEVGKHLACTGAAWDHEHDEPAVCSCWVDHHTNHPT